MYGLKVMIAKDVSSKIVEIGLATFRFHRVDHFDKLGVGEVVFLLELFDQPDILDEVRQG